VQRCLMGWGVCLFFIYSVGGRQEAQAPIPPSQKFSTNLRLLAQVTRNHVQSGLARRQAPCMDQLLRVPIRLHDPEPSCRR